jgi:hypothetical protein
MVPAATTATGEVAATLYELMKSGAVEQCDGIERIVVVRDGEATELRYDF